MLSKDVEAHKCLGKTPLTDWRASKENVCGKLKGNRPIFAIYV